MQEDWRLAEDLLVECPHCNHLVLISEINCQIFRHAAYKINGEQLPPHTNQKACEELFKAGLLYGCGKPFRIVKNLVNENVAVKCAYI
jgi:hypothetical protein